jgi:hypothetical protein
VLNGISRVRGSILSDFQQIERYIDSILTTLLFGDDVGLRPELFEEQFLESRSTTFMEKWKTFRRFTKKHEDIKCSDLRDELRRANEVRNRFAHGNVVFFDGDPYLKYFENSSKQSMKLSEEKVEEELETVGEALKNLSELHRKVIDEEIQPFEDNNN